MWGDHEGKPNLLLIAGLRESLRRSVGAPDAEGRFPGEDNPIYRAILAKNVAEAVCRKSLYLVVPHDVGKSFFRFRASRAEVNRFFRSSAQMARWRSLTCAGYSR